MLSTFDRLKRFDPQRTRGQRLLKAFSRGAMRFDYYSSSPKIPPLYTSSVLDRRSLKINQTGCQLSTDPDIRTSSGSVRPSRR